MANTVGQFTANVRAEGDVLPFRFVIPGTADHSCVAATSDAANVIGVSQGDARNAYDDNHAIAGDPCSLQPGDIVLVEADGAIVNGVQVAASTAGAVVTIGILTNPVGVALETAADTEVIRIQMT